MSIKPTIYRSKLQVIILISAVFILSCSNERSDSKNGFSGSLEKKYYSGKGVGPVSHVELGNIDTTLMVLGKELFQSKCVSCHYITESKLIGPGLQNVTRRRTPEWIMNQILNPIGMTQSDSMAKELLSIYFTQMVPMEISQEQARSILEYFRFSDSLSNNR